MRVVVDGGAAGVEGQWQSDEAPVNTFLLASERVI
jgi:hypothetical protein